jgi:hypothetical protein
MSAAKLAIMGTKRVAGGLKDVVGATGGPMGAAVAAPFVAESLVGPAADSVFSFSQRRDQGSRMREAFGPRRNSIANRYAKLMEQNRMLLATTEPHLYAELVADRPLAKGTQVYGAPVNQDKIQQVLLEMSRGTIGGPR